MQKSGQTNILPDATREDLAAEYAALREKLGQAHQEISTLREQWGLSLQREEQLKKGAPLSGICEMCESQALAAADTARQRLVVSEQEYLEAMQKVQSFYFQKLKLEQALREEAEKNEDLARTIESLELQQALDLQHLKHLDTVLADIRKELSLGVEFSASRVAAVIAKLVSKCSRLENASQP